MAGRCARLAATFAILGALLLTGVPLGHSNGTAASSILAAPTLAPHPATGPTWTVENLPRNVTSLAGLPARPATSNLPVSALLATPSPTPPRTTPVVMTFLTNSTTCCVSANFSAPSGTWAMILLNYTGEAIAGVYDSSFRAYVDQVQVLFGTTPEYGQWNVVRDVTPYSALLQGTFNFTFLLSAATVGGFFTTSVSLAFYPVAPGAAAPTEPDTIVPIWHRVFVSPSALSVVSAATVPTNVTHATLELWTYGFGPDEFWYTEQPNFRELLVSVDQRPLASVLPFPYLNTGGGDLFAWRPIPAVFTLDDRPYEVDVTGALGYLEGAHNFSANLTGVTTGSNWLIGGALLLTTSRNASAAVPLNRSFAAAPVTTTTDHTTYYDQATSVRYAFASSIAGANGTTVAADFVNETYSSQIALATGWENISALEVTSSHDVLIDGSTAVSTASTWDYPFTMDSGAVFVETSNTGGGYPVYGNFTDYLLNLRQEWDESATTYRTDANGTSLVASLTLADRATSTNDIFSGTEKLISANAAQITAILFIQAQTTHDFALSTQTGGLGSTYSHLLVGSSYQPLPPNDAETVLVNAVTNPLQVAAATALPVIDLGQTTVFRVSVAGGTAPYSYLYTGLPLGCSTANTSALACTPGAAGTYEVYVTVTDSAGLAGPPALLPLVVEPALAVAVTTNATNRDVGQTAYVTAAPVGGTPPYTCTWLLNGSVLPGAPSDCATPLAFNVSESGIYTFTVEAADSTGATIFGGDLNVSVASAPVVTLALGTGSFNLTIGHGATLVAQVAGGTPGATFRWFEDGALVAGAAGSNFTFLAEATGTHNVSVTIEDPTGAVATGGPVAFHVTAPSPPAANAAPSDLLPWELLFLAAGLGAGAISTYVALRLIPSRRALREAGRPPTPRDPPPD